MEQLRRAGFAVRPLVLRHHASRGGQGSAQQCCLREGSAAGQGAYEIPDVPPKPADVVVFADTLHHADVLRALQASLACATIEGLLMPLRRRRYVRLPQTHASLQPRPLVSTGCS